MKSGDRLLDVLKLFTAEKMVWSAEEASVRLGVTISTTYRYFRSLTKAGLLIPVTAAGFGLGPAIIEFDRLIQKNDPILQAARPVMLSLIEHAPPDAAVVLARLYGDRAMCIDQVLGNQSLPIGYERGKPMPIFRGATSKIMLAHVPLRVLKRIYDRDARAVASAGLGRSFAEFKTALARVRRTGYCIAHGEVDRGRIAIAAPIFDSNGQIQGSLTFVVTEGTIDEGALRRVIALVVAGADEIEFKMADAQDMPTPRKEKRRVRSSPGGRQTGRRAVV